MEVFPYRRICVVGTTGSGKSTMAEALAERLHIPHIELDAIHWQPGWKEADRLQTRARVAEIVQSDAWVMDGNYGFLQDIVLPRAEAVVWLDFPLAPIVWRLWWRTWRRVVKREVLWGTNMERLGEQFFSKDSLFLWAFKTHKRYQKRYSALPQQSEYSHLRIFRIKSPREAKKLLANLPELFIPETTRIEISEDRPVS